MNKSLKIVYFSWVRERIGCDEEVIALSDTTRTLSDLIAELKAQSASHAAALSDTEKLRFALDQDFAAPDSCVGDARELAIFPPVTGG